MPANGTRSIHGKWTIYDGLTDSSIRDIVDIVLDGPGVVFAEDGAFDPVGTPLVPGDGRGQYRDRRQTAGAAAGE